MPRKKKEETKPEYFIVTAMTNLIKISIRTKTEVEQLKKMNPDIRFCISAIQPGKWVRIK